MTMTRSLRTILAAALAVVAALPGTPKAKHIPEPHSTRTYYLGANGRVSQRKQLVGEIVATVRAQNTYEAAKIFAHGMPQSHAHIGSAQLDQLIAKHTGFTSFADLLNAKSTYRPSCDMREPVMVRIADAYDEAMRLQGDERRAYRYGKAA